MTRIQIRSVSGHCCSTLATASSISSRRCVSEAHSARCAPRSMATACNAIAAPTAPAMSAPVVAKDKSCAIGSKWMRAPSTAICAARLSARHPMAPG
eukprot:7251197-Prymnesium_polylepis.1